MDEDATWYGSRPLRRPHCIRRVPNAPQKVHSTPPPFRPMSIVATVAHLSYCWALVCYFCNCSEILLNVWEIDQLLCLCQEEVVINYNKLHADPKQGKNLDISTSLLFSWLSQTVCGLLGGGGTWSVDSCWLTAGSFNCALSTFTSPPLPSNRHHLSCGDRLEGKGENYQVCSVQYCVQQLCTVRCTHIWTD